MPDPISGLTVSLGLAVALMACTPANSNAFQASAAQQLLSTTFLSILRR